MARAKKVEQVEDSNSVVKNAKLQVFLASIKNDLDEVIYTSEDDVPDVPRLLFSIPSLDEGFGGGIAKGKVYEIFGQESAGKTTFCLTVIKQDQLANKDSLALYIDLEHALDRDYMFNPAKLGLDKTKIHIAQPDDLLHACIIFGKAAESGLYSVIIFDSTAGKVKEEDVETNYTGNDKAQATEARVLNQCLAKSVSNINKAGTIAIFCSQIRANLQPYAAKEVTTGGNSLKFYASSRLDIRRKEQFKAGSGDDAEVVANLVRIKFVKNKTGVPHKEIMLRLDFGTGFNRNYDLLQYATQYGVIKKSAAWYSYKGENIANGEANMLEFLKDHPDFLEEVTTAVYAKINEA